MFNQKKFEHDARQVDVVIRFRPIRPGGDDYYEVVSDDGVLSMPSEFNEAVKYCKKHNLTYIDESDYYEDDDNE